MHAPHSISKKEHDAKIRLIEIIAFWQHYIEIEERKGRVRATEENEKDYDLVEVEIVIEGEEEVNMDYGEIGDVEEAEREIKDCYRVSGREVVATN